MTAAQRQLKQVKIARSIILQQPWASAVAGGAFPCLVKSVSTQIRGWVGVLSTGTFDPHAEADRPGEFPLRSVVGAVQIVDSTPIEGNPLSFLKREFGEEYVGFYPKHFALAGQHVWRIGAALTAVRPRPYEGVLPRIWATTATALKGQVVSIAQPSGIVDGPGGKKAGDR